MFLFGHAEFELPVGQKSPLMGVTNRPSDVWIYSRQTSGGYKSDRSHLFVIQHLLI